MGRIGYAKGLSSEFQSHLLSKWEIAEHCRVQVEEPGSSEFKALHVPKDSRCGHVRERIRIEPQRVVDAA
jgi:hypothetical protein